MIHYEEPSVEGQPNMARGKVNWFNIEQLKKHAPELFEKINNKTTNDGSLFVKLKEHLITVLTKQGFVFFDTTLYRYRYHKGKLVEFGINYFNIK